MKVSVCGMSLVALAAWSDTMVVFSFTPVQQTCYSTAHSRTIAAHPIFPCTIASTVILKGTSDDEEEEPAKKENPYQDPNYPDLEFVDYSDPDYRVDQGVGDELYDPTAAAEDETEEQIEALREERRIRNDEFQFETYYKEVLKEGKEYKGEWTIYTTSTFADQAKDQGIPKVKQSSRPTKVISRGERIQVDSSEPFTHRLQNERLKHHEKVFIDSDDEEKTPEQQEQENMIMTLKYWPEEVASTDFRGQQGIMCVGNAYTICTAIKLNEGGRDSPVYEGPFAEYRSEVGIQFDDLRLRVKLDYAVTDSDKEASALPPLRLRSFIVCRETLDMWPRARNYKSAIQTLTDVVLFGPAGANNGLYDPPRIGSEQQAGQYLLLDLEGGATLLLPFTMDQDPIVHPESGWVTSLDWSPGRYRFQVDRKVNGGKDILGLKTLELSEVESADAETYRPRDGVLNLVQMVEVVSSKGAEHLDEDDLPEEKHRVSKNDKVGDAREGYKGNLFLVLEYVSHDLTGLMDVAYRFTEIQVKSVFKQLLDALKYMHDNKYVHRDIKSSNILIDHHFRLKLADFGLARCIEPPILDRMNDRNFTPEFTNKVITLWYRPPELLLGATKYGTAVDIWSAGCILAELLLGKPLFCGKKEMEQLQLIFGMLGTPTPESWEGFQDLLLIRTKEVEISTKLNPRLRDKYQEKMPSSALNLLEKLLELDPSKRLTADRALHSRYFTSEPLAPERPEDLGTIQVEGGHFHEFQTKKKRKEAKIIAEQARQNALEMGQSLKEAQTEFDSCYRGIMEKVAQEGLHADPKVLHADPKVEPSNSTNQEEEAVDQSEKPRKEKPEKKRSSRERDKDRDRSDKKARDERKHGKDREREKEKARRRRSSSEDEKRRKRRRDENEKDLDEEKIKHESISDVEKVVESSPLNESNATEMKDSKPPVENAEGENAPQVEKEEEPSDSRVDEKDSSVVEKDNSVVEKDYSSQRRRHNSPDEKDFKRPRRDEKRRSKSSRDQHKDRSHDDRRRSSRDHEFDRVRDRERDRRDRVYVDRNDFGRGVTGPGYDPDQRRDRSDRDMNGLGGGIGGPSYEPERNRDWDYDRNQIDRQGHRDGLPRPRGDPDFRDGFGPRGPGEPPFRSHLGPRRADSMGAYGPGGSDFRNPPAPPRDSGHIGHYGDMRRLDRRRSPPRIGDRGAPPRRW